MPIEVKRLAFGLGARVTGVMPVESLTDGDVAAIRAAWLEHLVVVFPDMDMTIEQHIAFGRRFGELELHGDRGLRGDTYPEVFRVTNRVVDGKRSHTAHIGRKWHSDGAFTLRPSAGSLLHCRAIPEVGGNTLFTNMYMAYESLSPALRNVLDTLSVVNDSSLAPEYKIMDPDHVARAIRDNPPVVQPMVRVHPETGRKALYLNELLTREIDGMTRQESAGLLNFLYAHSVKAEFVYRHVWRVNDVVLWDNRCGMHLAPADYDPDALRDMCRVTLAGERIGRLFDPAQQPAP